MKTVLLSLIRLYQILLSPLLPKSCRFYPTCSEYSYQAIAKHGPARGLWYTLVRLSKCHPFHEGGIDLVK
jgi:putative membrane protein insertion efficiency factor